MAALANVIGQAAAVRLLMRLLGRDRLPHAALLEGVPGCGRRTVARALAQALLCRNPQSGDACGTCASCTQVGLGTHPDLAELPHDRDGADLSIELLRTQVLERAFESALIGARRVFVLYGVERLRTDAANLLLKILEEPPAGTYLLMTTSNAGAVLKTIRSRTQLFRLQPLTRSDVARVLERGGVPAPMAEARARVAVGGHREGWDDVEPVPIGDLCALCEHGFSSERIDAVLARLPTRVTPAAEAAGRTLAYEQRQTVRRWLLALVQFQRDELRRAPNVALAERIEVILTLQSDLARNMQPRLLLEAVALEVAKKRKAS